MSKSPSARRRILTVVGILLLLAVALWLVCRRREPPAGGPGAVRSAQSALSPAERLKRAKRFAFDPTKLPPMTADEPAPVIDEIKLEKEEVCEGEENLITVKAHTVNGTDAFLHYTIAQGTGQSVPVRVWTATMASRRDTDAGPKAKDEPVPAPQPVLVQVFGRNNVVTTVNSPPFLVKKCRSTRFPEIRTSLVLNTAATFEISVKVNDIAARGLEARMPRPFQPVSYVWDFGDGTTETSTSPVTVHSYEQRPQDTLYAHFTITVQVTGHDGEKVVGRHSFQLLNPVFETLASTGILIIMTSYNPRYPELVDGWVQQGVRIWHTRPEHVTVEKVTMVRYFKPAEGVPESATETGDVYALLGGKEIPPGPGLEIAVRQKAQGGGPDWLHVTYILEGWTVEGWPAQGRFSVMKPPPLPTKEDHQPVSEMMRRKILRAREILGKDVVNIEDIWRLEKEGQFDDIPPTGEPPEDSKEALGPGPPGVLEPSIAPPPREKGKDQDKKPDGGKDKGEGEKR